MHSASRFIRLKVDYASSIMDFKTLNMETKWSSETSVAVYQSGQRNISENLNLYLYRSRVAVYHLGQRNISENLNLYLYRSGKLKSNKQLLFP